MHSIKSANFLLYLISIIIIFQKYEYVNCAFPQATAIYTNNKVLMEPDNYQVFWNTTDDEIIFEVHSKNPDGYTGFGLSPTGGMENSDIVAYWIDSNGNVNFTDRFIVSKSLITIDKNQDWKLIKAMKSNGYMIAQFKRKLLICDPEKKDIDISEGPYHLIYSYGQLTNNDLTYHSNNRGTKVLNLLGTLDKNIQLDMNGVETLEFLEEVMNNFNKKKTIIIKYK